MKTQHNIKELENKLNSFLMSNDVKIGQPISKKKYSPVIGCEYDSMSHLFALVIPSEFKTAICSFLRKNDLENIFQHEITGEVGYTRIIVYL